MSLLCSCICGSDQVKNELDRSKNGQGELKLTQVSQELLKFSPNIFTNKVENLESPFRPKKLDKKKSAFELLKLNEFDFSQLDASPAGRKVTKQRLSRVGVDQLKSPIRDNSKNKPPSHWQKKGRLLCFFCGGESCKHENYLKNTNFVNAITGLHSDYITNDIIASQRPSTILINKYNLIKNFKDFNIGLIVNVQREGEHPYCGPNKKLEDSGFSYNPSHFIVEDIKVKLSGWKDMSVPETVTFMLDIVKEMAVMIKEKKKKVLVHCHAGYGRTGVVIACYMIYTSSESVEQVVAKIREKRRECIQKKDQYAFCETFSEYINKARNMFDLFNIYDDRPEKKPIEHFLNNQKDVIFGMQDKLLEHIPVLIYKTLEKLLEAKKKYNISSSIFFTNLLESKKWSAEYENALNGLKQAINIGDYSLLDQTENIVVICQLLYDWLEDDIQYVIDPSKINKLIENDKFSQTLELIIQKSYINLKFMRKEQEVTSYLVEEIRKNLTRLVEMETLIKISQFFYMTYPENKDDHENFIHCVDRISLHLMGYKYFEIYNKKNTKLELIKNQVTLLSNIIQLFVLGMRSEIWENNFFLFPNKAFPSEETPTNNKSFTKSILKPNNNNHINQSPLSPTLKAADMNNLSPVSKSNTFLATSNENVEGFQSESNLKIFKKLKNISEEKQEEIFLKVYNKLTNYYEDKNKRAKSSKRSLLSNISNLLALNEIDNNNSTNQSNKIKIENKEKKETDRAVSIDPNQNLIKSDAYRKKSPNFTKNYVTMNSALEQVKSNDNQKSSPSVMNSNGNKNNKNFGSSLRTNSSVLESGKGNISLTGFSSRNKFINRTDSNQNYDDKIIVGEVKNVRYVNDISMISKELNDFRLERNLINIVGEKVEFDLNPNVANSFRPQIDRNDFKWD